MKLEYFDDTDTLLITFTTNKSVDFVDIDEDTLVEYDTEGRLVAVTVEHAKKKSVVDKSIMQMVA